MTAFSTPVQAALTYSREGWQTVPLNWPVAGGCSCERGRECASPGKHPWVRWRESGGTLDAGLIRWRYRKHPESGVAILTGRERSGLFAVDIDPGNGGEETIARLEDEYGPLPETLRATTGSRGSHLLFAYPAGTKAKQGAGDLGPGVDTRSDGGLIVAAPSMHRSGHRYFWDNWGVTPAELPAWMLDRLKPPPTTLRAIPLPPTCASAGSRARYAEVALERTVSELRGLVGTSGSRNNELNAAAFSLGRLVGAGLIGAEDVECTLLAVALDVGLGGREAQDTIASGLRAGSLQPRKLPA